MAVKIKLARFGKIRNPQYRISVADARNKRDGRAIEVIGKYRFIPILSARGYLLRGMNKSRSIFKIPTAEML